MKKFATSKRLIALLLAAIMCFGMLAGCGNQPAEEPAETPAETPAEPTEETPAEPAESEREQVELVWYVTGAGPQPDTAAVLEKVNEYLLEKLNCTLKLIETDFGSYESKIQMAIAGQEEFDLCFTCNWLNNYYNNVSRNAFLDITELLPQYAPDLVASLPAFGLDACKVNGKLYAIPNQQIWPISNGVTIDKAVAEKYDFDPSTITDMRDLEPLMDAIKADDPSRFPLAADKRDRLGFLTYKMGYAELVGRHIPGAVMLDDEELKVINQFELPQVLDYFKMCYEWNQKGYFRPDAATINDWGADLLAGKHDIVMGTLKPGLETEAKIQYGGRDVVIGRLSDPWLTTSGIIATMTAVSRTSKHPDRALEFLNLVNTDPYLYNLLTQGIEGVHYEKLDDKYIKPLPDSGYVPNADWVYGNQFLAYLKEGQAEDVWEETAKINAEARPATTLGFAFDPVPVQDEIAAVSAVVKEFLLSLDSGSIEPEAGLQQFLEKMEHAGSDVIIAEVQRQLDEWAATK